MSGAAPVVAGVLAGAAVLWLWKQSEAETPIAVDVVGGMSVAETVREAVGLWHPPAKYAGAIAQAESANGLPENLLARLLWQECRYREDIITGRVKSAAGALGIAQFMPATAAEMGVNPLDPFAAIDAAALYLARLYRRFAAWDLALAAYNWGQGNVARKGLDAAPSETVRYYSEILSDVEVA